MGRTQKRYTEGTVKAYSKKQKDTDGKTFLSPPKWRAAIREGVVSTNGAGKETTTWKTLTKTFSDLPCTSLGNGKYGGARAAGAALRDWRDDLIAQDLAELEAEKQAEDEANKPSILNEKVPQFLDDYIDGLVKRGEIERSTEDGYRYSALHAKAYFEDVAVGDVTSSDIEKWKAAMVKKGLSASTRNKAFRIIKQAYKYHHKALKENPFDDVKTVTPGRADPNPLDAASLEKLKAQLSGMPLDAFTTAVWLALRTGMREGEICGLRWRDVDMETGGITVCNAIGRAKGGTVSYEKAPKGRNGQITTRMVPGSPKLKELLDARLDYFKDELDEFGAKFDASMYVVGDVDGDYYNPAILGRTWRGFSRGLMGVKGRRPTFHDIRHTYATLALNGHIDPLIVASILGHKDPKVTMTIYAYALPDEKDVAQRKMDDFI